MTSLRQYTPVTLETIVVRCAVQLTIKDLLSALTRKPRMGLWTSVRKFSSLPLFFGKHICEAEFFMTDVKTI